MATNRKNLKRKERINRKKTKRNENESIVVVVVFGIYLVDDETDRSFSLSRFPLELKIFCVVQIDNNNDQN